MCLLLRGGCNWYMVLGFRSFSSTSTSIYAFLSSTASIPEFSPVKPSLSISSKSHIHLHFLALIWPVPWSVPNFYLFCIFVIDIFGPSSSDSNGPYGILNVGYSFISVVGFNLNSRSLSLFCSCGRSTGLLNTYSWSF